MKNYRQYEQARLHLSGNDVIVSVSRVSNRHRWLMTGVAAAALLLGNAVFAAQAAVPAVQPEFLLGAAGAWTFYNEAKKYIGAAEIDLNGSTFRMSLYTSASNAATATLSVISEVTNEVSEANGYSSSGKALSGVTWTVGASASEYRFNASATFWSANAGSIANIKFAVIWITGASAGARKLLVRSQLSTAQFTITAGNRLTITPSANGIFELN